MKNLSYELLKKYFIYFYKAQKCLTLKYNFIFTFSIILNDKHFFFNILYNYLKKIVYLMAFFLSFHLKF